MSRYHLSYQAEAQLDQLVQFISRDNPDAAVRVLETLLDSFTSLARIPSMGIARDDLRDDLRVYSPKKPAKNYVICYYEIPGGDEIAHIFHSRQDWIGFFSENS